MMQEKPKLQRQRQKKLMKKLLNNAKKLQALNQLMLRRMPSFKKQLPKMSKD
jgi:hypothetical protein